MARDGCKTLDVPPGLSASSPIVSVVLPVWNCPGYVGAAIESILSQTFQDFEFIIIDDGSTDETPSVLKRYQDARIRHVRHENRGLAGTLNVGIELARGKYIARQDQDDLSRPERLAKQMAYMESHASCALLGTWAQILEGERLSERFHKHPSEVHRIRYALLLNNPFVHSSVILRTDVVRGLGGYSTDSSRQPPEDFELWSRIARVAEVANLPSVLLSYREIPGSMSRQGPSPFRAKLVTLCAENIALAAGVDPNDPSARDIAAITHGADEMVSPRPDFRAMQTVFVRATASVAGDPPAADLLEDAKMRIRAMRAAYLLQRSPVRKWVVAQTQLRKVLKSIYHRLASVAKH